MLTDVLKCFCPLPMPIVRFLTLLTFIVFIHSFVFSAKSTNLFYRFLENWWVVSTKIHLKHQELIVWISQASVLFILLGLRFYHR